MLLGLMLEDETFEHFLRGLAVVVVKLLQRLELQAQGVAGTAFVVDEDPVIQADVQRLGQPDQGL